MLLPSSTDTKITGKCFIRKEHITGLSLNEKSMKYEDVTEFWWTIRNRGQIVSAGPDFDYIWALAWNQQIEFLEKKRKCVY